MAITEDQRHDLYEGLVEVLGREKATTLMEHLPPVGWADVATKRDLDHQSTVTRRDLEVEAGKLRQNMSTEFAAVRQDMSTEFASVRQDMSTEFASVRQEMSTVFAGVRHEMATGFAGVRHEMSTGFAAVRQEMAPSPLPSAKRWPPSPVPSDPRSPLERGSNRPARAGPHVLPRDAGGEHDLVGVVLGGHPAQLRRRCLRARRGSCSARSGWARSSNAPGTPSRSTSPVIMGATSSSPSAIDAQALGELHSGRRRTRSHGRAPWRCRRTA